MASTETSSWFDLSGVAIVTGASSGIGAHISGLLAAHGMTVVAAARRLERLEALARDEPRIVPHRCDVTSDTELEALVERSAELGPVTVIVNNAGISDGGSAALDQDPALFRHVVEVNLNAVFVLSAAGARHMIELETQGSIINISSVHGMVASAPNSQAAYVASKTAVVGLTRELAGQWARRGVRVNAIAPGYFPSELTAPMLASDDAGLRYIRRNTFLGRPGELDELDGPVLLLASPRSSYMTGLTLPVDGGWTAR